MHLIRQKIEWENHSLHLTPTFAIRIIKFNQSNMKQLSEKIFDFSFGMPEFSDSSLEETEIYKTLRASAEKLRPSRLGDFERETFNCAVKIISLQFVFRDWHGDATVRSIRQSLENIFEMKLNVQDIESLSEYFSVFKKTKTVHSIPKLFGTVLEEVKEENIFDETKNGVLLYCIMSLVEIHLERLKVFYIYGLPKQFWYDMYSIRDNDDDRENIDSIVMSILG